MPFQGKSKNKNKIEKQHLMTSQEQEQEQEEEQEQEQEGGARAMPSLPKPLDAFSTWEVLEPLSRKRVAANGVAPFVQSTKTFKDHDSSTGTNVVGVGRQTLKTLKSGRRQAWNGLRNTFKKIISSAPKSGLLLDDESGHNIGGLKSRLEKVNLSHRREDMLTSFVCLVKRQNKHVSYEEIADTIGDYVATLYTDSENIHTSKLSLIALTGTEFEVSVTELPGAKLEVGASGNSELSLTITRDKDGYHAELLNQYGREIEVAASPSFLSVEELFGSARFSVNPIKYDKFSKWSAVKLSLDEVKEIINAAAIGGLTVENFHTYMSETVKIPVLGTGVTIGAADSAGYIVSGAGSVESGGKIEVKLPGRKTRCNIEIKPFIEENDPDAIQYSKVGTRLDLSATMDPIGASISVRGETIRPANISSEPTATMSTASSRLGKKRAKENLGAIKVPFSRTKETLDNAGKRLIKGDILERLFGEEYAEGLRETADLLSKNRGAGAYHDQSREFVLSYSIKDSEMDALYDKHAILASDNQVIGCEYVKVEKDMSDIIANPMKHADKLIFDVSMTETLQVMDGTNVGFGLKKNNSTGFILENTIRLDTDKEATHSGTVPNGEYQRL